LRAGRPLDPGGRRTGPARERAPPVPRRRCPPREAACSGSPAHSGRVQPGCRRCARDVEQPPATGRCRPRAARVGTGALPARRPPRRRQSSDHSLCPPQHLAIVTVRVALCDSRHATGVPGDTTFSSESGESGASLWQGIADGDRRSGMSADLTLVSSQGTARAMRPRHRERCPAPQRSAHRHLGRRARLTEGLPCQSTGGGVPAGGAHHIGRATSCR